MKRLIAIILVILILITLIACSTPIEEDASILKNRFEYMGYGGTVNGSSVGYYRDTVTDVVYVKIYYGMSVLVKEDGTPYLWSELVEESVE